jgi:hypothetical protein
VRTRFRFDPEPQRENEPLIINAIARALIELQRLWMFVTYLAYKSDDDDDQLLSRQRFAVTTLLQELRGIELLEYTEYASNYLGASTLEIRKIRYESPLEIESEQSDKHRELSASRLRSVVRVILHILAIDLVREKFRWDTEIARQRAIEAALKNEERALNLSKRIKDPLVRDEFIRRMANSIVPLSRPSGLRLKEIEVLDAEEQESSAAG